MCHELKEIQHCFETYFKGLYTQTDCAQSLSIQNVLISFDLLSIGTAQNKIITCEITKQELDKAISRLKTNKMPGPDGYPAERYKTFRDILSPILLKCLNFTLKVGKTPVSWSQAIISQCPCTDLYRF